MTGKADSALSKLMWGAIFAAMIAGIATLAYLRRRNANLQPLKDAWVSIDAPQLSSLTRFDDQLWFLPQRKAEVWSAPLKEVEASFMQGKAPKMRVWKLEGSPALRAPRAGWEAITFQPGTRTLWLSYESTLGESDALYTGELPEDPASSTITIRHYADLPTLGKLNKGFEAMAWVENRGLLLLPEVSGGIEGLLFPDGTSTPMRLNLAHHHGLRISDLASDGHGGLVASSYCHFTNVRKGDCSCESKSSGCAQTAGVSLHGTTLHIDARPLLPHLHAHNIEGIAIGNEGTMWLVNDDDPSEVESALIRLTH